MKEWRRTPLSTATQSGRSLLRVLLVGARRSDGHGFGDSCRSLVARFEPFCTTKPSGKGTGLGLATVYGIAKHNQGFVWACSEPGMGTSIKIYLPCVHDQPVAVESPDKIAGAAQRGTETVLLVEDEEPLRRATGQFLRLRGYTVLEARDGIDALPVS